MELSLLKLRCAASLKYIWGLVHVKLFSSLYFLVEVTRVTGTKASPEQIHECLLQIAGEGKQREQGTFSTDPASCSEVSGSYFPHLPIKGK